MSVLKKIKYKLHLKNDLKRRLKIIKHFKIDVLFDVGANVGQYAQKTRNLGYNKKIISFEPLKADFEILKRTATKDKHWIVNNYALGHEDTVGFINISGS
jgi:hypothetical protein